MSNEQLVMFFWDEGGGVDPLSALQGSAGLLPVSLNR